MHSNILEQLPELTLLLMETKNLKILTCMMLNYANKHNLDSFCNGVKGSYSKMLC